MTTYSNISVHVTDPSKLSAIERAAKRRKMSRSAFIFQAAVEAAEATQKKPRRKAA